MKYYETVSEALNDLNRKGYTTDFSLLSNENKSLKASEFEIDEVHRFEGDSDPGDEMVLFAISSKKHNTKGVLLNAFGIYSDSNNSKKIEKLKYQEKKPVQPIKRAPELVPLSREHHHSLLLCWKIKAGLAKNIALPRIKIYVEWYYKTHLLPHFEIEEKYVFTILGESNKHIQKAIEQHNAIKDIIEIALLDETGFIKLQNLLNEHIRFEERILFNEIQKNDALKNLVEIADSYERKFHDNETDPFWI